MKGDDRMTGRYVNCPAVYRKLGRRVTLMDRIRRWLHRPESPDVYEIIGYCAPIYPGK